MGAQRFRASSLFLAVSHAAANTTRSLRRGTERDAERRGVQESTHVFFFPLEQKQRDRGGSEVRMKVRQAVCVCEREFFFLSLFSPPSGGKESLWNFKIVFLLFAIARAADIYGA